MDKANCQRSFSRNCKEGHIGFACYGARKQRFARPRRAHKQNATRNPSAQFLESLRIAQEFNNFLEIVLGLVDPRDVLESHPPLRLGKQPRFGLAKAHGLSSGALHLPGKNDPDAQKRNNRQRVDEDGHQPIRAFRRRLGRDRDILLVKRLCQRRIIRRICCESPVVGEMAAYLIARDRDLANVALVHLIQQLTEGYVLRRYSLPGILKQHDKRNDEQKYDYPKREIPEIRIHLRSRQWWRGMVLSIPKSSCDLNPSPCHDF